MDPSGEETKLVAPQKKPFKSMLFTDASKSFADTALTQPNIEYYQVYFHDTAVAETHITHVPSAPQTKIYDFIPKVIKAFNLEFQKNNINLKIAVYSSGVSLYLAKKKNGKPNLDYPAFDHRATLEETKQTSFAIAFDEKNISRTEIDSQRRTFTVNTDNYRNSLTSNTSKAPLDQPQKKKGWCSCLF